MNRKKYKIVKINIENFNEYSGYIETLDNLKTITKENFNDYQNNLLFLFLNDCKMIAIVDKKSNLVLSYLIYFIYVIPTYNNRKVALLENVVTNKIHQNKGFASTLIKIFLSNLSFYDVYRVRLSCNKSLVPFYKKFGFKQDELTMTYYLK